MSQFAMSLALVAAIAGNIDKIGQAALHTGQAIKVATTWTARKAHVIKAKEKADKKVKK